MTSEQVKEKEPFLLGQPLFVLERGSADERWRVATHQAEPRDERSDQNFPDAMKSPDEAPDAGDTRWVRCLRPALVAEVCACLPKWHRVACVCGAGLGKTTNLAWLESQLHGAPFVGGEPTFRGPLLAFRRDIDRLPADSEALLESFVKEVRERVPDADAKRLTWDLQRRRAAGNLALLLDSLDQAGANPKGTAVANLTTLLDPNHPLWQACPFWVTGRPDAFKQNPKLFGAESGIAWTFLRVGQLDEPECAFLLEVVGRPRKS